MTVNYREYIQTKEWKKRATRAKRRAGWKCQLCNAGGSETSLHTHHRTYERLGHEQPGDLTVLCSKCHAKFHDIERDNQSNQDAELSHEWSGPPHNRRRIVSYTNEPPARFGYMRPKHEA